jgi:hypothetical protein
MSVRPLFGEAAFGMNFEMPLPQTNSVPTQGPYSRLPEDATANLRPQSRRYFRPSSSLYSATPNPNLSTANGPSTTPRASWRGLWGPRPSARPVHHSPNGSRANLPQNCQMPGVTYSPASVNSEWNAPEIVTGRVPLSGARSLEQLTSSMPPTAPTSSENTASADTARRQRRKHHRRRHHQQRGWVRSHRPGTSSTRSRNPLHAPSSKKNSKLSIIVASLFLCATVVTYLAIALAVKGLAQELHILFALTIAAALIFLIHSLVRYFTARKRRLARRNRSAAKQVATGPNFAPIRPIRVHMVQDEEAAAQESANRAEEGPVVHEKVVPVKLPPPAYGLWRSSVVCCFMRLLTKLTGCRR